MEGVRDFQASINIVEPAATNLGKEGFEDFPKVGTFVPNDGSLTSNVCH